MTRSQSKRHTRLERKSPWAFVAFSAIVLLPLTACSRGGSGSDSSPAPVFDLDLAGRWEWQYDKYNMTSPCLLHIWQNGNSWRGRFIQHPDAGHQCAISHLRLVRVNISGNHVSMGFSPTMAGHRVSIGYRFTAKSPSRLEGHVRGRSSAKVTLIKRNTPLGQ